MTALEFLRTLRRRRGPFLACRPPSDDDVRRKRTGRPETVLGSTSPPTACFFFGTAREIAEKKRTNLTGRCHRLSARSTILLQVVMKKS